MEESRLSVNDYPFQQTTENISLLQLIELSDESENLDSWIPFFSREKVKHVLENISKQLSKDIKNKLNVLPYPELIFNSFNLCSLENIKVVIIGQDPYFRMEQDIPQAMGLSFSVPEGLKIPSSLQNIYKNLIKFGHIDSMPNHGNLEKWAKQGCLMLNATLTVIEGKKNIHAKYWGRFTNRLIKYVSIEIDNCVFVLWGRFALNKKKFICGDNHKLIISSHPSGLSCNRKMGEYKSFNDLDHFGEINEFLLANDKSEISWEV